MCHIGLTSFLYFHDVHKLSSTIANLVAKFRFTRCYLNESVPGTTILNAIDYQMDAGRA